MELNQSNFEEKVLKSNNPVVVDFYAPWCGPCRQLAPIMEQVALAADNAEIYKLNIDNAPAVSNYFNISAIPTLIFFKDGKVIKKHTGMMSLKAIQNQLSQM
jgi:thioredoxin 1